MVFTVVVMGICLFMTFHVVRFCRGLHRHPLDYPGWRRWNPWHPYRRDPFDYDRNRRRR